MTELLDNKIEILNLEVGDGEAPQERGFFRADAVRAIHAGNRWAVQLVREKERVVYSNLVLVSNHPSLHEAPPDREIFITLPEGMAAERGWNLGWCDLYHTPDNACGFLMSDHILYSRTGDVQTALLLPKGTSLIQAHSRRDKIHPRWKDTPAEFEMYIELRKPDGRLRDS